MRVLVAYCSATKAPFVHALSRKGIDSERYAEEQIKQDALSLGHSKSTIRGDNEPALVQVVDRTLAALRLSGVESALAEVPACHDLQTNGAAENAVTLVKGRFRTLLPGLERQLWARVPLDHPMVAWFVSH